MYRAEDAMYLLRKRQWDKEDAEFAQEQERRKKEAHQRRLKKNRERRQNKEAQESVEQLNFFQQDSDVGYEDKLLARSLKSHFSLHAQYLRT